MDNDDTPVSFVILGETADGQRFRPSDWADRLCGVMSPYRPKRSAGGHLTYSPWVMPGQRGGLKTVTVDARLHALEPLAWRFIVGFARDNGLRVEPVVAAPSDPASENTDGRNAAAAPVSVD